MPFATAEAVVEGEVTAGLAVPSTAADVLGAPLPVDAVAGSDAVLDGPDAEAAAAGGAEPDVAVVATSSSPPEHPEQAAASSRAVAGAASHAPRRRLRVRREVEDTPGSTPGRW
ncbi:MAG: hypothetical protein R2755_18385 [Acidimicrobiales bacterium]